MEVGRKAYQTEPQLQLLGHWHWLQKQRLMI